GSLWLAHRFERRDDESLGRFRYALSTIRVGSSLTVIVALALRAWAHTAAVFSPAVALMPAHLQTVVIESRWGRGWQEQAAATLLLATAAVWNWRARSTSSTIAASITTVAACFVWPQTGHAASQSIGPLLHGSHLLAAGLWAGTLSSLTLLRYRGHSATTEGLLRAFAPLAGGAVALLVFTGIWAMCLYLTRPRDLWTTTYGGLLTAKLAGVVAMGIAGAANWYLLHRRSKAELSRSLLGEVAIAVIVLVLTGFLTETAHP
ncbi:MAG: CopD family protein, partial [Vicinamibacterales bacterium]